MHEIKLTVSLTDAQAWRVAKFIKRLYLQQILELSEGTGANRTEDAYSTRDALYAIALELAREGYNPQPQVMEQQTMLRTFWRWIIGYPAPEPCVWRALAVGGGGAFTTPPLSRADAIRYVTLQGTHQLCWVDDANRMIFFRYK